MRSSANSSSLLIDSYNNNFVPLKISKYIESEIIFISTYMDFFIQFFESNKLPFLDTVYQSSRTTSILHPLTAQEDTPMLEIYNSAIYYFCNCVITKRECPLYCYQSLSYRV